jgi:hypothetical protein
MGRLFAGSDRLLEGIPSDFEDESAPTPDRIYGDAIENLRLRRFEAADVGLRAYLEATRGATDSASVERRGRCEQQLRRFAFLSIRRLRERNQILLQERSDQLGPALFHEQDARLNERLLDWLESVIRRREAVTIDGAFAILNRAGRGAGRRLLDARRWDVPFSRLLDMERRDGIERLADPGRIFGRRSYLFREALSLLGPNGSYRLAAPMLREVFEPELMRARGEVGATGNSAADERRAFELLERWHESGELARRDSLSDEAWRWYVRLENPLQDWTTVTYAEQDAIGQNLLLLALTGPLMELAAPGAGAAVGLTLAARLGMVLRAALAQGAILTAARSLVDQEFHPSQAVADVLMCGAFSVAGELAGPALFRAAARTGLGRRVVDWVSQGSIRQSVGERIAHWANGVGIGSALTYLNPFDDRGPLERLIDNAGGMAVMSGMRVARERPSQTEPEFGVSFFDRQILERFYSGARVLLGSPNGVVFFMPLEDARQVRNVGDAARLTGMAPAMVRAMLEAGDPSAVGEVYGVQFPTSGFSVSRPTASDANGWAHFLEGGNTAARTAGPHGAFLRNPVREFVTRGGNPMPTGSTVFRLGEGGQFIPIRRFSN